MRTARCGLPRLKAISTVEFNQISAPQCVPGNPIPASGRIGTTTTDRASEGAFHGLVTGPHFSGPWGRPRGGSM